MENEIRRGDMYWLKDRDSVGSEERLRRPVVIVSSEQGLASSPMVQALSVTTKSRWGRINVRTMATGRESWIMCNQINTWDKTRLDEYLGTLSEEELEEVDRGIMIALGLKEEYIEEYEEEPEEEYDEDEIIVERDMYKRLYERALEMLVDKNLPTEKTKKPEPPKVVIEESAPLIEINTCSEDDLRRCGCNPTMVRQIINNRPYKSVEDLRKVPQVTSVAYNILKAKVCCVPVVVSKSKKININTATIEELSTLAFGKQTAQEIVYYRNHNGPYKSVEDLLVLKRFGKWNLKKYGPMLEV